MVDMALPQKIARVAARTVQRTYHRIRTNSAAPIYGNPTEEELASIEAGCQALGIRCKDLEADVADFQRFIEGVGFPENYHGGRNTPVYREKLLEHYLAWHLLELPGLGADVYVDIAACSSPWARLLRDRGLNAFAIDLVVPREYSAFDFYREENAVATSFASGSVRAASLQCAYEMFEGENDIELLRELARILAPGGRVVVSPLYMHTHPCYYQTPEHFGRTSGDAGAARYIRRDCWGVRASRKYSAETLHSRVWTNAVRFGLEPTMMVLRNKLTLGSDIYCHFVLQLTKQRDGETAGGPND